MDKRNRRAFFNGLAAVAAFAVVASAFAADGAGAPALPPVVAQETAAASQVVPNQPILAICYHAVEDTDPDQTFVAVATAKLVEQFAWLRANGYHVISVDDIVAAQAGQRALPDKPVLITFDDGYVNFYTRALPILKAFGYPAVLAIVGAWMPDSGKAVVKYGDDSTEMPRNMFLSWDQVREIARSGLVEIAAHTNAQHEGILANPQGNLEPALVTRRFDPPSGTYEGDAAYRARLSADAQSIAERIHRETGRAPRAVVWPFGAYNGMALSIYGASGMTMALTLDDGVAKLDQLSTMPRLFVEHDPDIVHYAIQAQHPAEKEPIRAVQIDLDKVYDSDPAQQARNVDALVQRLHDLTINVVILQAFADPEGTGLARQTYFPNRRLPMRADLFNRVAWQLKTRAGYSFKIYGWLPVLSFDFGALPLVEQPTLVSAVAKDGSAAKGVPGQYHRLSPFDPKAASLIGDVYEDLARNAPIDGFLFHDDALLSDFEDASPLALEAYRQAGLPDSVSAIRANPELFAKWTELKTTRLIDFTHVLTDRARVYRSPLTTVRNIYSRVVLEPQSRDWFAQDFDRFLDAYDYTAILAMPRLEGIEPGEARSWLSHLVEVVGGHPNALEKTIFEVQAVDWTQPGTSRERIIPTTTLVDEMRMFLRMGARNFGYYPDDFVIDAPTAAKLHRGISLQSYPYRP